MTFGVTTALALASGICLLGVSYEAAPRAGGASESRLAEIVEGFRLLRRDRETGRLAVLAAVQTFTRGCLSVFVIVVAVDVLGMGDAGAGVLTAALGAGAVVGSLAVSMMADGRRLAVLFGVGVALWGLPLIVVGAVPREVATLAMLATIGFANALVDVGLLTLPARRVPDASLARVFGAITALATFAVAVGSLVTPPVIELVGIRWALVVIGLAGPVAVVASWHRLREIDRTVVARDADIEMLKAIPMLRPLPMPAIENLAARVGRLHVAAGRPVFAQGDGGDRYYVIEHGAADVVRNGQPVRTLGDGDGFGEIALVRDVPRTATVVARTPLELRTVDRPDFVLAVGGFSASREAADGVVVRSPGGRRCRRRTAAALTHAWAGVGQAAAGAGCRTNTGTVRAEMRRRYTGKPLYTRSAAVMIASYSAPSGRRGGPRRRRPRRGAPSPPADQRPGCGTSRGGAATRSGCRRWRRRPRRRCRRAERSVVDPCGHRCSSA